VALKHAVVPKRTQEALIEVLPTVYQFLQQNPQVGVHHDAVKSPEIKLWLPVYVGRQSVVSKGKVKRASRRATFTTKRVAWLCFIQTKRSVNAAIELQLDKSGTRHQFQQGAFIHRVFLRMKSAAQNKRLERAQWVPRLLSIPGLYFSALWFKSVSRELFVSLVKIGDEIKVGGFYSRSDISSALDDEVLKRRQAHRFVVTRKQST
jgi:hypothetical protein